jgi:hypothetical protein
MRAFYSMAFIQRWLVDEAARHGSRYLILRAASQMALFTGRLLLALNRILFPYHKWLRRALEEATDVPPDYFPRLDEMLEHPSPETVRALFDCVRDCRDWGVSDLEACTRFMTDVEWSWIDGVMALEDL